MSSKPPGISATAYSALITSYREDPGNHTAAARAAGTTRRTAQRGYERGWEHAGLRAIGPMIREEQAAARRLALIHAEAEERRSRGQMTDGGAMTVEQERTLTAKQRAREAILARAARDNSLGVMGIVDTLLKAAIPQARRIQEAMASQTLGWKEFVQLSRAIALIHGLATKGGRDAIEIERLRLGLPSATLGINIAVNQSEAVAGIEHAQSVLARARELGLVLPDGQAFTGAPGVLPGGAKDPN